MSSAKKTMSERAVERLEEEGYLKTVRAEMRAEVMKCLVEMEEVGDIPPDLRIKRYTPETKEDKQILIFISEFLRFHGLKSTHICLENEINPGSIAGRVDALPVSRGRSSIAAKIAEQDDA
jgi:hypothetical protein